MIERVPVSRGVIMGLLRIELSDRACSCGKVVSYDTA